MFKRFQRLLVLIALFSAFALHTGSVRAADPITIKQWDSQVTQTPAWNAAIKAFQDKHPNIKIERQVQTNTGEIISLAFQAEVAPDIFEAAVGGSGGDPFRQYIDAGYVAPLSDFADWKDFLKTFPNTESTVREGNNAVNGKVYSMKFNADQFWLQFYINTSLYKQAGIVNADGRAKLPVTWEDVLANSRTIKQKTGKLGYGFGGADGWVTSLPVWSCQLTSNPAYGMRGFGYSHLTGEFHSADNPCIKGIINTLITMRDERLMPDNVMSLTDEQIRAKFAEGEIAHLVGGIWIVPGWKQTHPKFTEFTSTPLPLFGQTKVTGGYGGSAAGRFIAISAKSKHPQEAWEWYKYVHSAEFGKIWADLGNGLTIFTPGDPTSYTNEQTKGAFETAKYFLPEPEIFLRNPDTGKLQVTLQGPGENDIFIGIFTKQITDVDAALKDLDKRNTEALAKGIADAQAAGAKLSIEDFIVRDWKIGTPYNKVPDYSK